MKKRYKCKFIRKINKCLNKNISEIWKIIESANEHNTKLHLVSAIKSLKDVKVFGEKEKKFNFL